MFLPSVPGLTLSGFCTQDRMILYLLHFLLYILLEYACVFSFILLGGWGTCHISGPSAFLGTDLLSQDCRNLMKMESFKVFHVCFVLFLIS